MPNLIFGTAGMMIGLICIRKDKGKRGKLVDERFIYK